MFASQDIAKTTFANLTGAPKTDLYKVQVRLSFLNRAPRMTSCQASGILL